MNLDTLHTKIEAAKADFLEQTRAFTRSLGETETDLLFDVVGVPYSSLAVSLDRSYGLATSNPEKLAKYTDAAYDEIITAMQTYLDTQFQRMREHCACICVPT
jgi:hypothetical protein